MFLLKLIIEGVRGSGYTGDIAIDDFEFKSAACSTVPPNAQPGAATTSPPTTPVVSTTPVGMSPV